MGARVPKDHARVEALGAVDELNAAVAVALAHLRDEGLRRLLEDVQDVLFTVGAELSAAGGDVSKAELPRVTDAHVEALEEGMAALALGPVEAFLLPRGSPAVAFLHLARVVARRAERRVVSLSLQDGERVAAPLLRYLNRLSSLLFAMAVWLHRQEGGGDEHPTYGEDTP
jgi:cob(I)alamin adenosyltransferase